ncbi:unnamed protein product [Closterium sp. NIES-54]
MLRPCPAPAPAEPRPPTEPCRPTEPHYPSRAAPAATAASAATATTTATAATAAMASPNVLTFDAEGRAVDFDVWVDDLQLFLRCDSKDGVSIFDHTSAVSPAPAATADCTVRSQWTSRDAVARLAVRSHLPSVERAHFGQYKTAKSLYDAVVARYSSPATAALSRLMLPYLFPDLAAFAIVADLITHLRTSDARYRTTLPTDFCAKNLPPMYITFYNLVTRLPDSLASVKDQFLSLCPTELTVDLLEEPLTAAKKSIVAVGASRGDRRAPFFEGCSRVPLLSSVASAAAVDLVRERGGRVDGGSGEAQAQGQPRDSAMAPMQPKLGPPRDEPRVFGLDKFNGDNFAEWSFKMENIFDHYDLLEVMEGTEKRPENDPEKSLWVQKSAQGYLLLGQALGSSQIRHIKPFQREPEKGPKAWAALKGVHAPATAAVAVVLERQMAAVRIEEDEAVEEGVQKFFDLLTRLEGADLNYSELQKKTKLLALLPESWSSLIINLNRDLPHLSLEDVKRAILQEDFRRRELASADGTGAASIGRGYGRGRGRGRGGGRFGGSNFKRGRGSSGYGNDNKNNGRGHRRFDGECHFCHKSRHMWRNCYKLPDGWTPAPGQEGRGAGGGRGRGRGGRGGRGGGAASMKSAGNESESRDDRFPGQFFFVSTQASAGPEKDEGFEEPEAVGKSFDPRGPQSVRWLRRDATHTVERAEGCRGRTRFLHSRPWLWGCSGSGGGGSGSGGGGGGGGGAGRGGAAQRGGFGGNQRQQQPHSHETPSAQQLREWYAGRGRSGGVGPCTYILRTCGRRGETCELPHTAQRCFGRLTDAWRAQFPDTVELSCWGDLLKQNVAILDLDFDAILATIYAASDSAEGDCYLCVLHDPGIEAAALGASESAAPGTSESVAPGTSESAAPGDGESTLSGTAPTEALHTFTIDSGASRSFFRDSTTLTPLSRPVAVSLADPSGGTVLTHSSTVLPYPEALSGLLSGLHLPSFSTNLVSGADLQDLWVDQFTPGGQRVTHCTCSRTGHHLATFTRRPGSSLYTLTTASPPVTASGQVAASSQVFAAASKSSPASALCSCRPLSHEALLWHHRLGHSSLPRLRGMASRSLVSGLPRSLPPLPRDLPLPVFLVSRAGSAPLLTPPSSFRQRLRCRLSTWTYGGGEISSDLLRAFYRAEGISQTFTLPASPQQNGIAERRIGMVMDVARTSMIHAAAPHFLWPFAVQYAAHQINLQPRVSLPETTATLRWTGKVGDASVIRV